MKINLFGNNKFERLQGENRKLMKMVSFDDSTVIKRVDRALLIKGISPAYTEIIKHDMIEISLGAEKVKGDFITALGGDVEKFVEDVYEEAPRMGLGQRILHSFESAMYNFMVYVAVIAFLLNVPPHFKYNVLTLLILVAGYLALVVIGLLFGSNALDSSRRDKNSNFMKIGTFALMLVLVFITYRGYEDMETVNTWAPIAISVFSWLLLMFARNYLNNKELKNIEANYE